MNKIEDERLKLCPFCGEPAVIWYFPQHDRPLLKEAYYVGCTNDNCGCELEHTGAFKSLDDAVSAWNRRPLEQEPIIDKIRAEILEEHENAYAREDNDTAYGLSVALDILDKYKAESEKT